MFDAMLNQQFWDPVCRSFFIASCAAFITAVIGTYAAAFMFKRQFPFKIILEIIFILPIVLPPSVVGFLLLILIGKQSTVGQWVSGLFGGSLIFTIWAAIIASVVAAFPLMYQSAKAGFQSIEPEILEAGMLDGADRWRMAVRILFPMAKNALTAGIVLSFTRALGEFGATLMVAGNIPGKTQTISTAVYQAVQLNNMNLAWAWVSIMIMISAAFLFFIQRMHYK